MEHPKLEKFPDLFKELRIRVSNVYTTKHVRKTGGVYFGKNEKRDYDDILLTTSCEGILRYVCLLESASSCAASSEVFAGSRITHLGGNSYAHSEYPIAFMTTTGEIPVMGRGSSGYDAYLAMKNHTRMKLILILNRK